LPAVGTLERTEQDRHEGSAGTLGEVLYADKTKSLVPEKEWVALVQAIVAGDQRALHGLYQRTHRIVFTLTMRITGNRETAEEVTLDVFHDVWRRASSYDAANGTVIGWIMNQARSRAIDRVRLEQRKKRVNPDPDSPVLSTAPSDPRETVEREQQSRLVRDAVAVLTPGERAAIEATFFSDSTHAEAAARLNEPLGTVKTRIRAGLMKLRQALTRE
jgi:RNA polymerase sigma-70 factor (ECF subfamily)